MKTTISRLFPAAVFWLLAACAGGPTTSEAPAAANLPIIGEVREPRKRAQVHTDLAAAYIERGNMGVALEELRVATAADANYAPAHGMLGVVHMELGEMDQAAHSFERALSLSPNDADINHNYGVYLCRTKREPEAVKRFMQAIKNPLYNAPWRSYSAAGVCTLRANNVKEAEQYFERALRMQPDEPASLLNLGGIRYQQGKMDEARRLVARYNKLGEPSAESLWLALRIERRSGQRVAEQSFATQLRRRFPGSAEYQALQRGKFD